MYHVNSVRNITTPKFPSVSMDVWTSSRILHHLWCFNIAYTICNLGLNYTPRGLKASPLLIVNMILFINISNFSKWNIIYIQTFGIAHWDTKMRVLQFSMPREDTIKLNNDKCLCSHYSMQEEDILEHTKSKCHLCTL
jgi:hypothetical protein